MAGPPPEQMQDGRDVLARVWGGIEGAHLSVDSRDVFGQVGKVWV